MLVNGLQFSMLYVNVLLYDCETPKLDECLHSLVIINILSSHDEIARTGQNLFILLQTICFVYWIY